jgi:hypothetical protein
MNCDNKLKINEYVSISQLKKKLKAYLTEQGCGEFKPSIFSQGLIMTLVMILEELISDCLKNTLKDKSGLYIVNYLTLKNILYETDKFATGLKYLRKYNSSVKYHDSVFFNIKKVIDNLETKHGSKLMIDSESRNTICYIILCLQYDIVDLSLKIVKYSNRKTLNIQVLEVVCSYLLSGELSSKIKLKLDSSIISNSSQNSDDDDGDGDGDGDGNENGVDDENLTNVNSTDEILTNADLTKKLADDILPDKILPNDTLHDKIIPDDILLDEELNNNASNNKIIKVNLIENSNENTNKKTKSKSKTKSI